METMSDVEASEIIARRLARQLGVSEVKVAGIENVVQKRIQELTARMLSEREQQRFNEAIQEMSAVAQAASTVAVETHEQNLLLVQLLQKCTDFVVETAKKNEDTLPSCIEVALIFLTERALLKNNPSGDPT